MDFTDKTILITGGTGSLGKHIVKRLMTGEKGSFKKIIIFSRDEDKHYQMSLEWKDRLSLLEFRIGDVRDYPSVLSVMRDINIVIHTAALKQKPNSEYSPLEAIKTNIFGIQNIVRAIKENPLPIETVVIVSTDKACQPVNTYGMTKAIQERIAIESNISINKKCIKVICVRYGNVMASRGSIIPLFQKQIKSGQPLTITSEKMTRFMMSLDNSVDTILTSIEKAYPGEIYIPTIPSVRIIDIIELMTEGRNVVIRDIGIRPGEKIHEILVSTEESIRTVKEGNYIVVIPWFPEIKYRKCENFFNEEFSSKNHLLTKSELKKLLIKEGHLNF